MGMHLSEVFMTLLAQASGEPCAADPCIVVESIQKDLQKF
jgi:hypothetical protein